MKIQYFLIVIFVVLSGVNLPAVEMPAVSDSANVNAGVSGDKQKISGKKSLVDKIKDMKSPEILNMINQMLNDNPALLNILPGLAKAADLSGSVYYTYNGAKIEDIDKEGLGKLYVRMRQEINKMRTERIMNQIANIERTQRLTAVSSGSTAAQARISVVPPSSPAVPREAPKIPGVPAASKK